MDFTERRTLGGTGLMVGRLGVASGYGAPAPAFEEAFERGCNYFYWGSRRTPKMAEAIGNIIANGKRDDLVIVVQSYNRIAGMIGGTVEKALGRLGIDYADVLLLGWHNKTPSRKVLDASAKLKDRGLVKHLAMSGHHRPAFPVAAETGLFDIIHLRYNAAHRGAESDVFPKLPEDGRPGVVVYTATRWGHLLKPKRMPPGEQTPRASDCYRFALMNPMVDVCITGPKDRAQMKEALAALDRGPMSDDEMDWMRRVGDHVHKRGMF